MDNFLPDRYNFRHHGNILNSYVAHNRTDVVLVDFATLLNNRRDSTGHRVLNAEHFGVHNLQLTSSFIESCCGVTSCRHTL